MSRRSTIGLATFFLVAFGIPWAGWLLVRDENLSLWLFPLFASIAGFFAAYAEGGKGGLKVFSRRVFAIVPSVPYVLAGAALPLLLGLSYLLTKGVPLFSMPWSPAAVLALSLGAALVTGPIAEEFGWRGYLQHRLLNRFAPFWTALIVGGIWWVWHGFSACSQQGLSSRNYPRMSAGSGERRVSWILQATFSACSGAATIARIHPGVLRPNASFKPKPFRGSALLRY